MFDVVIVGGGAAGMMAAVFCAQGKGALAKEAGACGVLVLERMDRAGKKLLATGNGRCNLANTGSGAHLYGENAELMKSVAAAFGPTDTLDAFHKLGLECTVMEDGRVYPYCMQAAAVLEVLRNALVQYGVQLRCGAEVSRIEKTGSGFAVHTADGQAIPCKRVVLAAGGKAAPSLGSNGSGHALAQQLGHRVTKTFPALVQMKSGERAVKSLNGIRVGARASALLAGRLVQQEEGEIQFTQYGLSGIPIMQLSRFWGERENGESMAVQLDFMPEYTEEALRALLQERKQSGLFETLESWLVGLINKKIGYAVMARAGLKPLSRRVDSLGDGEICAVAAGIKEYPFAIEGAMPWANAQVTAGGVDSREFDSATLESLKVPGLFACGEVLDVYGDCGGHNLQWAWATGAIAGQSAARG